MNQRRFAIVITTLLAVATISPRAGTVTVFGPRTLTRTTGTPNASDYTFSAVNPSLAYTLQIDVARPGDHDQYGGGGRDDGDDSATSAVVTLNGTPVVGPSDFTIHVNAVQRRVTLQASNALHVELRGKPATRFTIRISGDDSIPPRITANAAPPPNTAGWNTSDVTVGFTCADSESGVAACPAPVMVTKEGAQQIVPGTATDNAGNTATASLALNIDKTPPVVTIVSPADGAVVKTSPITVSGTASDAVSGLASISCRRPDAAVAAAIPGAFICSIPLVEGLNTIAVTATDVAGLASTAQIHVTLATDHPPVNRPPVARAGGPYAGTSAQAIVFDGSGSSDPDNDTLSYTWTFGDGTTGSGPTPSHLYTTADQYTVTLNVSDGRGGADSAAVAVSVARANRTPAADAGGPYSGDAGSPIAFSATRSSDPDGDSLTFAWDFGDGATGTGATPIHAYTTQGTFTVTLTASDGHGGTNAATTSAVVGPAADRAPPVVKLSVARTALPGTQAIATADATDNVAVTSVTFDVDGAGSGEISAPPYQRTIDVPALAIPGSTITVTATARDAAGNAGSDQATITIVAAPDVTPPTVTIQLPPRASPGATIRLSALASDEGGVKSVSFSAAGQSIAADTTPPFEAAYVVPADAVPGTSIAFAAHATDFSGNSADSSGTVPIVAAPDTTPPTVSLTAPPEVVDGGVVHLSATATDDVSVASVDFSIDGVVVSSGVAAPFAADVPVPATRHAGSVLRFRALATDSSGNQASSDTDVRVVGVPSAGTGVVAGTVYDDTTGLPLDGVAIALTGNDASGKPYAATATTDSRGKYFLAAASGQGTLQLRRTGWTRVDRGVAVVDQTVSTPLDARPTPVSAPSQTASAIIGGTLKSGDAALVLAPGALASDTAFTLTAIGAQGLEGVLPAGWSPVGAVDIAPHGVAFNAPQTISLTNRSQLPASTPLVVGLWDEAASAWRAIGPAPIAGDATQLTAAITSSGQYVWLLPDSVPASPAMPEPGSLVAGVTPAPVPDDATIAITPKPKIIFYQPGINSNVSAVLQTAAPLPSGTPLRSTITESYQFTSATELHPDPFVEDVVLYQSPAPAAAISGSFVVTPSMTFDPLSLQQGVITVELSVPASATVNTGPGIVGAQGGTVSTTTGESVQVPAGAFDAAVPIDIEKLTPDTLGVALTPPFTFVGAVSVSFAGAALKAAATITVPRPAQLDDTSPILLMRLAGIQGSTRLLLVGVGRRIGTRIVSDSTLPGAAAAFDGVATAGRYVFVRSAVDVGFATGTVFDPSGAALAGALVTGGGLPSVSLSRAAGQYLDAVQVGAVTLTAQDLNKLDTATVQGTIAGSGPVLNVDFHLAVQVPRVTSLSPADGSSSVALSTAVVATFSEPIDPSTITGSASASIAVTAPDGSAVAGAVTLSAGNTKATFRPGAPLTANTAYTVTISTAIKDPAGRSLPSAVVAHFTSLDTSPPPPPPAGSITASMPDASGNTTITGTQGSAGLHDTVSIVNVTKKTSFPALVDPNGGFHVTVAVQLTDTLRIVITDQNGNQTVVPLPAFTRVNPDGSIATVVNSGGGRVNGPGGTAVDIPPDALPDGTVVTVGAIDEASFPIQLTGAQKGFFAYQGGVQLDFGGATPSHYVNVSLPTSGGETRDDRWMVGQVATVGGQQVLNIVDTARVINGRITTSSPPCPGVQAAAQYAFIKSPQQQVGLNYGRFANPAPDPFNQLVLSVAMFGAGLGVPLPYSLIATASPSDVCLPVLTGRVTVTPNSQKIVIPANAFTPADREIVVRNLALGADFHFPRNVAEYRFLVEGSLDDNFSVVVVTDGSEQAVPFDLSGASPGFVNVRLQMDTLSSAITEVIVRNSSRTPVAVSRFPQSTAAVKLPVSGGGEDGFDVSIVDVNKNTRSATFTIESPSGSGNLVARAVPVTIDPGTSVFLERRDGADPSIVRSRVQIPPDLIQFGGFTFPFDGDAQHETFRVEVDYPDSTVVAIAIPAIAITISNPETGRVIRTFNVLVPPPDEPFNLGSISGDITQPFVTGTPPLLDDFDPSGVLTVTFSEGIDRNSALKGVVLLDDSGSPVSGSVRLDDENRSVTFVPDAALKMGAHYTLLLNGLTDGSGNKAASTALNIKTFAPKTPATFTAADALDMMRYLTLVKKTAADGSVQTLGFGVTGDLGDNTHKLVALDLTNPAQPVVLSVSPANDYQRLTIVQNVHDLQTQGDNPCGGGRSFSGDLALVSTYSQVGSSIRFFDVTNPSKPCQLGAKLLTVNPAESDGTDKGVVFNGLGFARGVAALPNGDRLSSYTAVENVGIMLVDVGNHIPPVLPAQRVREPLFSGNYTDVLAAGGRLLAIERSNATLDLFDGNLAQLSSTSLPLKDAIGLAYSEGVSFDLNQNGQIDQDEVRNLAFVGGTGGVAIVDVTSLDSPVLLAMVPMPGAVYETAFDAERRRLFAAGPAALPNGPWTVFMIDLSGADPFSSFDRNDDGFDDRITWKTPSGSYTQGTSQYRALLFDPDRRVLYVGLKTAPTGTGGFDVWTLDNRCCDLGIDFTPKPKPSAGTGGRPELLLRERKALQTGLGAGLQNATASCGVPIRPAGAAASLDSVAILEQGSGACLWKTNPVAACTDTYQPGLSDHDFEVLIPARFFDASGPGTQATCVTTALNDQFTNADGSPKEIIVDGVTVTFPDITFFPVRRENFEAAKLDVLPPAGLPTGDIGLGRQQLLLKWALEGEYVAVPKFDVAGKALEDIVTALRTQTGIPLLEGYEWGNLQKLNLVKSNALLRIGGASEPGSSLHDVYLAQLHDAGKAGIRAALARIVADPAANGVAINVSRADYASNACRNIKSGVAPDQWNAKPCTSFEEYVAAVAAKSLGLKTPLFTASQVSDVIHWFYRVKADVAPTVTADQADGFVATASSFIDGVIVQTQAAYDDTIGGDVDSVQRARNLSAAQSKTTEALASGSLHLVPRFFNHGFVNRSALQISMFRGTSGPGATIKTTRIDLGESEQRFIDYDPVAATAVAITPEDRNLLDLTRLETSSRNPVFVLGNGDANNPPIDFNSDKGVLHYAAFTIDLPEKKVKEADRSNNVNGFWYYVLDRDNPSTSAPSLPPPPQPLPDPKGDLLKPDAECSLSGDLRITQSITVPGGPGVVSDAVFLQFGDAVTYGFEVVNDSGKALNDVVACTSLLPAGSGCFSLGTLAAGEKVAKTFPFTAPSDGQRIEAVATVSAPDIGVRQSTPLNVYVSCEPSVIVTLDNDPNPTQADEVNRTDASKVMRGGRGLRYYRVVDRKTGVAVPGASVLVEATGPNGTATITAQTTVTGRVVSTGEPGIAIPVDASLSDGDQIVVKLTAVNGVAPFCESGRQFTINVADRTYMKSWAAGSSIGAEGTIEVGLQGKTGTGFSFTLADIAGKGHSTLSFGRSDSGELGVLEKVFETGARAQFGPLHVDALATAKASLVLQRLVADQHDFAFPAGSSSLDQPASAALGGLLTNTVASHGDPLLRKALDAVANKITSSDSFKVSELQAFGLEGSFKPKASLTAGYAFSKKGQDLGNINYGIEESVGASASIGYQLSIDDRAKTKELVPAYEMKSAVDLGASLGLGSSSASDDKGRLKLDFIDALNLAVKAGGTQGIKVALTLDADTHQPTKLVLTFSGAKRYGWEVGGKTGGSDLQTIGNGVGDKGAIKFTITNSAVISRFLAAVASYAQLTMTRVSGEAPSLGLKATAAELQTFLDTLVDQSDIQFEQTLDNGDAFSLPAAGTLSILGVSVNVGLGLSLDRTISFTTAKGVVKSGGLFPLARYTKDALIPDVPTGLDPNLDDFKQLAGIAFKAASDFSSSEFDVVQGAFTTGINTIRSRHTAQIVFSGANETPFDPAVMSFTFTPIPTPALAVQMQPDSVTGLADKPHYGLGGFHQFLPADHVFASPATLTVFYTDDEVASFDKSTLGIYRWNGGRGDWDFLGGVSDPANDTVTVTVDRMGLYTVAPPMPAGTIALTAQSTSSGTAQDPHTIVTYTSAPLQLNNGQPVADGTMFTVLGAQPSSAFASFGTVTSADEDPATDGVQVSAHNGIIQFTVDYPAAQGLALVIAASREGTALAAQTMPLQQP